MTSVSSALTYRTLIHRSKITTTTKKKNILILMLLLASIKKFPFFIAVGRVMTKAARSLGLLPTNSQEKSTVLGDSLARSAKRYPKKCDEMKDREAGREESNDRIVQCFEI